MAAIVMGPFPPRATRDAEGHREYRISYRVQCATTDGPATIMQAPGLPRYGDTWRIRDDVDVWAWCRWDSTVTPVVSGTNQEVTSYYDIEFRFSTKQGDEEKPPGSKACKDNQVEDPLLEPQKISGGFVKYTEEAVFDRFGRPITNSAWQQIRGPQVEFDASRQSIKIEQNVPDVQLPLVTSMRDCVNDTPLWGMPPRCVKLTNFSWERKFYGGCNIYFTRHLEFELRYDSFDRDVLDEGTKALSGRWAQPSDGFTGAQWILVNVNGETPNPWNPAHFLEYLDKDGNKGKVILDGLGQPYNPNNTNATCLGADIIDGGTDYLVGDIITLNGGTFTIGPAQFRVSEIGDEGNVTILGLVNENNRYTSPPSYPISVTGGSGGGLLVDTFWKMTSTSQPGRVKIEKYNEANFLLLRIPTDLRQVG